jgi:hypothetical protein
MVAVVAVVGLEGLRGSLFASGNVLTPLASCVPRSDVECARHATGAIANVAEDTSTHEWIVKEEGVHFLVQLMRSRHLQVYREASRAMANLLVTPSIHDLFLAEDGLKSLFRT